MFGGNEWVVSYFYVVNWGKIFVICDLKNDEDLVWFKVLIGEVDVLVENFKVGGLVKYGLDYESLKVDNL